MRFGEVAFLLSMIGFCWLGWVWFLFVRVLVWFFLNKLSPFVFWSLDFNSNTSVFSDPRGSLSP